MAKKNGQVAVAQPDVAAHTPGPWEIAGLHAQGLYMNDGGISITAAASPDGRVALVDLQSKPKRGEAYKAKCQIRDANARLIAAAPDLLAACVAALDMCEKRWDDAGGGGPSFSRDELDFLRAAIAKAEGV